MKNIILPGAGLENLVYYLAAEEYIAEALGEGFFCWRTGPCVIFGRNQDMEAEVNLPFCREHGIETWRRKSGGGCVYSDGGNLMLSYIVGGSDVRAAFGAYLEKLAGALSLLGVDAVSTSHNDVMAGDRKISGNACFSEGGVCIVHGTLMYDVDFEVLSKAITPSREKLESHGVKSVRQRVGNLRQLGLDCGMEALQKHLTACFTDGDISLDAAAESAIRKIQAGYMDPDFIKGKF